MSDGILFELITPEGLTFSGRAYEVLMPTPGGQIAVLPHHMPLVTLISTGVISIRHRREDPDEQLDDIACAGGVAEVSGKRVRVLADVAERAEAVDELRAKAALAQAEALRRAAADQVAAADALGAIELNLARLKVADLKRRRARRTPGL
ncbi:MAG: ATP synthase F1 subunit epsilon [Candidatus Andersenbacteria bacterium]|nr:ATP synthase F1 subunit epsilon [Candidatus Andersenbacteria bacterium]